jgi:cysteine-rich repeat protein
VSDLGHVTITVTAVNDAPVVSGQSVSTNQDTPITITLSGSDIDSGTLLFSIVDSPASGALGSITQASPTTATVTYTPAAGSSTDDAFTFRATDGAAFALAATVSIDVVPAPVCSDGVISGLETCDDLDLDDGDGCSSTCQEESGWDCTGSPSSCATICNDGLPRGEEECDDGDFFETNGCTTSCKSGPVCTGASFPGGDAFVTDPTTGTCYAAFDGEPTTFGDAYASCVAIGGHLVTITGATEQAFVGSIQLGIPWIGASEDGNDTDAVFDWITTESWSFASFTSGEPDDDAGFGGNGECLAMVNASGGWGDTNCNFVGFTTGRVCELADETCGDGIEQGIRGEQCDDGNTSGDDGCSATCQDEFPGFIVTPTTGLVTSEAGGTAPFTLRLRTAPSAPVTIGISSSKPEEGTPSRSSETFDSTNWFMPRTIVVTGADDLVDDGNQSYSIVLAPDLLTFDPVYAGLDPPDVSVSNTDDE